MNVKKAITRADDIRPNAISDELKFSWVFEIEGHIAELLGVPVPEDTFPQDSELLMGPPYESIYERYLCAMIDLAQQDTALYANDYELYNATMAEAMAQYRRTNKPAGGGYWRAW